MGARLLRQWLCYPLRDVEKIRSRQRLVDVLRTEDGFRTLLRGRTGIGGVYDINRRLKAWASGRKFDSAHGDDRG